MSVRAALLPGAALLGAAWACLAGGNIVALQQGLGWFAAAVGYHRLKSNGFTGLADAGCNRFSGVAGRV